jgi:hypothetical protein
LCAQGRKGDSHKTWVIWELLPLRFPEWGGRQFVRSLFTARDDLREGRRARWLADRLERILKLCGSWLQKVNGGVATKRSSPIAPA